VPISHPNGLKQGDTFEFVVQFNGKPLAGHEVSISYSNMDYSGQSSRGKVTTDASGKAQYRLEKPGLYLASIRLNEEGPLSADKPNRSYSKSLTFNVSAPREARPERADNANRMPRQAQ